MTATRHYLLALVFALTPICGPIATHQAPPHQPVGQPSSHHRCNHHNRPCPHNHQAPAHPRHPAS
jgi:hypothetical protein